MEIKNQEILKQLEKMLAEIKKSDRDIYDITMQLLSEVYTEYNSGRNSSIENKLYRLIDDVANKNLIKNKK